MLCCLGTPWTNSNDLYQQQTGEFPGNRRFRKTAGNALADAADSSNDQQQQRQTASLRNNNDGRSGDIVCVTIPPGVSPGQAILVTAPDGSGRTIMVTVPQGLTEGSAFMAEFPPSSSPPSSPVCSSSHHPPLVAQAEAAPVDYSQVTPLAPPPPLPQAIPPPTIEREPFAQAVPVGVGPNDTTISPIATRRPAIGTRQQSQSNGMAPIAPQSRAPPPNQKLLLVQVPPGVCAGDTIHVSIPEEPGRVVAATVPPNVSEFQVAYQPMINDNRSGVTNTRNGSSFPQGNANCRNGDGGMSSMLLPAMGGAALGMMGMSMYDHSRHYSNNTYADNYNGTDGGGFGGGGFGGGDFGGGDF